MKLAFAVMPWHALDFPCLASGILTTVAQQRHPEWEIEQIYANLRWAEHLTRISAGFSVEDYSLLGNDFVYDLAGEWVFSSALLGIDESSVSAYREIFPGTSEQFEKIRFAYYEAQEFIDSIAR